MADTTAGGGRLLGRAAPTERGVLRYKDLTSIRLSPTEVRYPFTPGWSEESRVKCLSQGHNVRRMWVASVSGVGCQWRRQWRMSVASGGVVVRAIDYEPGDSGSIPSRTWGMSYLGHV
ncbi:hypothetical protein Bbelb_029800 [Branchiostoma belcheri]|nr:hypothetical protein Bbelb_029800 [Branchiostoma belcheri]